MHSLFSFTTSPRAALPSIRHAWRNVWWVVGIPAILMIGLIAISQLPRHDAVDVGVGEGYGGDLPHLQGFHTAEQGEHGTYRWTRDGATITFPGIGQRSLILHMEMLPITEAIAADGPQEMQLWAGKHHLATLPVRREGAHVALLTPPRATASGVLALKVHTQTFSPAGDPRDLGTPLDRVAIVSPTGQGTTLPPWEAIGWWVGSVLLLGIVIAILQPRGVFIVVIAAVGIALAAWLDAPRWGFGAFPVFKTVVVSGMLALGLSLLLPRLARWANIPLGRDVVRWLILVVIVCFGLRYGGRLYPNAMHGDIFFHANRVVEAFGTGNLYLTARNRGVDFPYPPAGYLLLAPFTLLANSGYPTAVLECGAALIESISIVLLYGVVAVAVREQIALLATAVYGLAAAGLMTSWWSFDTHIYTQALALLLMTAIVLLERPPLAGMGRWRASGVLFVLLTMVFLGHFGFFINTVAMGGLLLIVAWQMAHRGDMWARAMWWPLSIAYGGAMIVALAFFYSAYVPLFLSQAQVAATEGLSGLADRDPVSRGILWRVLWEDGVGRMIGLFPIALLPSGLWVMAMGGKGRTRRRLSMVIGASLIVSGGFALLPFLTLSTQNTRWMMFSLWAIASIAAVGWARLWQRGRAGRVVVGATVLFFLWNTAVFWLQPLAWRIRPPEPF